MRCLKTRTILGLLTAAWLIGVVYFLKDIIRSEESTHEGDAFEDYERSIDHYDGKNTGRVDDIRVSGLMALKVPRAFTCYL